MAGALVRRIWRAAHQLCAQGKANARSADNLFRTYACLRSRRPVFRQEVSKTSYRQPAPRPPARLGEWLRQSREARGLTLAVVAEAVGVDLTLVSKVELGQRLLSAEQAAALARFFGADPAETEARRVAEEIRHYYGANPATPQALQILNDSPLGAPAAGKRKTR